MIFGTVCSGIGAPEVAWAPLGWRCAFMSEIDAFPRAVLTHHYPATPLHGDFTTIQAGDYEPIDLLCGGTPCQSFSIIGLRGGMADERGNLALEFLRLADRLRPRWVVWENVPGVRSSSAGRGFGAFLGGMGELGYGWAYRGLDAQYFGLAQRRERVFVVGYLGDWRPAAAVLFEQASLRGDNPPSRKTTEAYPPMAVWWSKKDVTTYKTAKCLTAHASRLDFETENFVVDQMGVRRITPIEAERLQGFQDNHTKIVINGRLATDGKRMKALGNSMAVPVIRWIGGRISLFDKSSAKPDLVV